MITFSVLRSVMSYTDAFVFYIHLYICILHMCETHVCCPIHILYYCSYRKKNPKTVRVAHRTFDKSVIILREQNFGGIYSKRKISRKNRVSGLKIIFVFSFTYYVTECVKNAMLDYGGKSVYPETVCDIRLKRKHIKISKNIDVHRANFIEITSCIFIDQVT